VTHTALPWVRSNTPAMREVDWMNGSQHNTNANRQTEIPDFIREKNMFSPLPLKLKKLYFGTALLTPEFPQKQIN